MIRLGRHPRFFISRIRRRLAAIVLRQDDFVENIAVLIDGAPEPVFASADRHDRLVQMPRVIGARRFPKKAAGMISAELLRPASDRLTGNDNAALQQHLFDQAQAQRKSEVEPDRVGNHRRREAMRL